MKTGGQAAGPATFLARVRRRYMIAAFLALCLPAALLNEAYRWAAYGADRFFGFEIPYLNTGPYFLLAAFFLVFRRWSLPRAATFADSRLSFRDRLVSFIDFSRRDDLSPGVRLAQEAEVTRRLHTVRPASLVPLRIRHVFGPLLLAASLMYPLVFFSSSNPPPFLGPSGTWNAGGPRSTSDNLPRIPAEPLDRKPGDSGPTEKDDTVEGGEDNLAETRGNAGGLDEVDSQRDGSSGEPADPDVSKRPERPPENPFERDGNELATIVSKRTGLELSNVVDPVFASRGGSRDQDPALPGGSMSFRLIPKTAPASEASASTAIAEVPATRIDIDFTSIPERYRRIVRRYFTDLERIATKGSL